MDRSNLPVVPATVLNRHHVAVPTDTRFRAIARLGQALWRKRKGFAAGDRISRDGVITPLGSRLSDGATTGDNFLTPDIAQLAWHEACYQESNAIWDQDRLWSNMLGSQPLTLNALGLLKLDLAKATIFIRAMIDDLVDAEATAILFEHSPDRTEQAPLGRTALDAVIWYKRENGRVGFIAMEIKYTENLRASAKAMKVSAQAAMMASKLYRDASDESLRKSPLQQITREHVLAQASLMRGDVEEARFIVVYPELNEAVGSACARYAAGLVEPQDDHVRFGAWTLEAVAIGIRKAVGDDFANAFEDRYLNWAEVQKVIDASRPVVPEVKRLTDRRKR